MKWCAKNRHLERVWYHAKLMPKDEDIISMISAELHEQFKNLVSAFGFSFEDVEMTLY